MKKSKNRALLVLSTFVALSLASCSGLTPSASSIFSGSGSEGSISVDSSFDGDARIREIYDLYVKKVLAEGETPSSYEEWLESIKGKDGTTFLFGLTDPAQNIGSIGDVYLNTSSWDVLVKSTEGWTKVGNILGGQGIQGPQGEKGEKGDPGEQGEPGNTPYIGDNGHWWIGDKDTGIPAQGPAGQDGQNGQDGKDGLNGQDGKDGLNGQDGKDGLNGQDGKDGLNGQDGQDGADGLTPFIGQNGNWWIGDKDTGVPATGAAGQNGQDGQDGANGLTPHIGENGNWWIGDVDTKVPAQGPAGQNGQDGQDGKDGLNGQDGKDGLNGQDGKDGKDGADGLTPRIGENGNWWIGDKDTGIKAEGSDGAAGQNGQDGKDGLNGQDGKDGKDGQNGVDGRTAWSNTILPSVGGYVTVNFGSAYVGESITFMAFPDKDYELADITLNGNSYAEFIDWENYSLTVPMVEHGYVVRAIFYENVKPEIYHVSFYGMVDHGSDGIYYDRVGSYWLEAGKMLGDYAISAENMLVQSYSDRYNEYKFDGWDTDVSMPVYGDLDIHALYYSSEKEPVTNREFYGTEHEGNLDDPFDNEDAILVTKKLDSGDRGRNFVIEGTIDTFYNGPESRSDFQYAFYLTPEEEGGERFEAYNAYRLNEYKERYELGFDDLFHGAHVVFEGPLTTYTFYTSYVGYYQSRALYGEYIEKYDSELVFHCTYPYADDAYGGYTSYIASYLAHSENASFFEENGFQATLTELWGGEFTEGLCDALEGKTLAQIKSDENLLTLWNELYSWWNEGNDESVLDFFVSYSEGKLGFRNIQCETEYALIHSVEGTIPTRAEREATVAEAIAVAANMKVGDTTEDIYTITGYVVKRERGRYGEYLYYISDTKDIAEEDINDINCFILDPYLIPNEDMLAALGLGAKISYRDHIHNYAGRAQSNRYFLDGANLTILEAGEAFANVIEGIGIFDKGGGRVESIKIPLGSSTLYDIALYPEGSDINGLKWNVYGSAVSVKISASGQMRVEGNELGDTTIEFFNENGDCIGKFAVYVYDVPVSEYATQIWSATWNMKAYVGESKQLMAIPWPFDSHFGELKFVSSDESVATVDAYGMVTAIAPGEVQIIVSDLVTGLNANMNVTVLEYPDNYLEPFEKVYYANSIQSDPEYAEILAEYGIKIDEILEFHLDGTFEMYDRDGREYRESGRYYRTDSSIILDFNSIIFYDADYPQNSPDYICDFWHEIYCDEGGGLYDESQRETSEGEIIPFRYVYSEVNFIEGDISGCSYLTAMMSTMPEGYEAEFLIAEDLSIAVFLLKHDGLVDTNIAQVVPYGNGLYYLAGPNIFVTIDLAKGTIADPDVSEATIFATGTIYNSEVVLYDNGIFSVTLSYGETTVTQYGIYTAGGDGVSYKLDTGSGSVNVTYTPSEVEGEPGIIRYEEPPTPQKMISYNATFDGGWDITKDGALIYVYYWTKSGNYALVAVKVAVGEGQQATLNFELPEDCEGFIILRINPENFDGTLENLDWDNDVWNKTTDYWPAKMESSFVFKF